MVLIVSQGCRQGLRFFHDCLLGWIVRQCGGEVGWYGKLAAAARGTLINGMGPEDLSAHAKLLRVTPAANESFFFGMRNV